LSACRNTFCNCGFHDSAPWLFRGYVAGAIIDSWPD
jgi:hypothetical protein